MALESGIGGRAASRGREASSIDERPVIGTAAAVALGRALDTRLPGRGYHADHQAALDRLRALRELRQVLEQLERVDVLAALRAGHSFEDVGRALGMSRSAAHRKHGGPLPPGEPSMSRYALEGGAVVGWDPPLQSFFVIVRDGDPDHEPSVWLGCSPRELYQLEDLLRVAPAQVRVQLTPELQRALYADRDEGR